MSVVDFIPAYVMEIEVRVNVEVRVRIRVFGSKWSLALRAFLLNHNANPKANSNPNPRNLWRV